MVYLVLDKIRVYQYCGFYYSTVAICNGRRRGMLWMLPDFDYLFAGTIFCRQSLIVLLLIGSAIMLSLGIIGYYIAKIYEEVKRRPRYIISQILRGKEDVYQEVNHDCSH